MTTGAHTSTTTIDDAASAAIGRAHTLVDRGCGAQAVRSLLDTAQLLMLDGDVEGALDVLEAAIDLESDSEAQVEILERQARAIAGSGDPRAPQIWSAVAEHRRSTGDDEGLARALYLRYWETSGDGAIDILTESAGVGSIHSCGWAARAAAVLAFFDGDHDRATQLNRVALERARENGDRRLEAQALTGLAISHVSRGEIGNAIDMQRRANATYLSIGDHQAVISGRLNLFQMLEDDLQCAAALAEATAMTNYVDDHGLRTWRAEVYAVHASKLAKRGHLTAAATSIDEAIASVDERTSNCSMAYIAYYRATALIELGEIERAVEIAEEGLGFATSMQNSYLSTLLTFTIARCGSLRGDVDGLLEQTATIPLDDAVHAATVAFWLAHCAARHDRLDALQRAVEIGDALDQASTRSVQLKVRFVRACTAAMSNDGDLDPVLEVARELLGSEQLLDGCRALCAAARMAVRRCEPARAAELMSEAYRRLTAAGAHVEASLVAQQLSELMEESDVTLPPARRGLDLFAGLTEAQRSTLESFLVQVPFFKDKVFYEEDDVLDAVYVLRGGRVRLCTRTTDGKQLTVELLDAGDVFGESAILSEGSRSNLCAEAMEDGVVGVMSARNLRSLLKEHPTIAMNVVSIVAERMQRSQRLAAQIAFSSVEQRLVHLIVELDRRYGHPTLDGCRIINRAFTQSELAEMIAARRDTVSQLLNDLRKQGLIDMRKRRIVIQDIEGLRAIVE